MATAAQFTSVRVVCNNTLSVAVGDTRKSRVATNHRSTFNPNNVKSELGLFESSWDKFQRQLLEMKSKKVTVKDAYDDLLSLFSVDAADPTKAEVAMANDVHNLYLGGAMGSDMAGHTAWGLLNAVTEYHDWHVGRNANRRLNSTFWGTGNTKKNEAFNYILENYDIEA
jgi:hypothetical protein